jgi:DNA-binding NtrC family response regulator
MDPKQLHFSYLSPGADSPGSRSFLKCCAELGYIPHEIDINAQCCPKDIAAIYIDKPTSESRSKLESFMPSHQEVAGLGIVDPDAQIDKTMTTRFLDIIRWPCTKDEVDFRVNKISVKKYCEPSEITRKLLWQCNLVGQSTQFIGCIDTLRRLARCDAPILINGETGTGKELAARAVHYSSQRGKAPFVPVNCAALPDSLLENELFGHEKGAFTDAKRSQKGLVAQARGGTLFLDEIDSLSLSAQAVLLRFVQDGTYRKLGSEGESTANVRIVAATNQDLSRLVEEKRFREDLRYRLEVFTCTMPPLRSRGDDALVLANYFAKQFCAQYKFIQRPLHPAFIRRVKTDIWPGNVRQLENEIHKAVVLSEGQSFICADSYGVDALSMPQSGLPHFQDAKKKIIDEFEFNYLSDLIHRAEGNVTKAAKMAGKERRAFGKLLKKHRILPR